MKYQTVLSATFAEQDEDGHTLDETELYNNLNNNQNLTQFDIKNVNTRFQLEHQRLS